MVQAVDQEVLALDFAEGHEEREMEDNGVAPRLTVLWRAVTAWLGQSVCDCFLQVMFICADCAFWTYDSY